eukprot:8524149-Alexandrium_andersonii.AAC.1
MIAPAWNGPGFEPVASGVPCEAWSGLARAVVATVVVGSIPDSAAARPLGRRLHIAAPGPGAAREAAVWLADSAAEGESTDSGPADDCCPICLG